MKQSVVVILIFLIFSTTVKIRANDNSEKKLSDDIRSRIAQSGYEEYLEGQVGYARDYTTIQKFRDRSENVLDKLNGNQADDDCAARSLNVNPIHLYQQTPRVGQCYVSKAEIWDELSKKQLLRVTIQDNETLKTAPKEIQDKIYHSFPNGVPQGGLNIILENADEWQIVAMNDNFGLPGDDLGKTSKVEYTTKATQKDGSKIGLKMTTTGYSKLNELGEYYDPQNPRQRIVDDVAIKFFTESPGVKIAGLTVNGTKSIGWREISTGKKANFLTTSRIQQNWHNLLNKIGPGAPNYKNDDLVMEEDNGEFNFGRGIAGLELSIGLKLEKLLESKNGHCYMKFNGEVEATASSIPGSSNFTYGGSVEEGFKVGRTTFFAFQGHNAKKLQQKGDKTQYSSEVGGGIRRQSFEFKASVISEKGARKKMFCLTAIMHGQAKGTNRELLV